MSTPEANPPPPGPVTPPTRPRNPRGQGARLRTDIVRAAEELMDEHGTDRAVTLRSVARRVGISAPSIYAHFADVDGIFFAVVEEALADLGRRLQAAAEDEVDPVGRLRDVCAAYLQFAVDFPQRYRLMFAGIWNPPEVEGGTTAPGEPLLVGNLAFGAVQQAVADCAAAGRSPSTDPFRTSAALWAALHGLAELRRTTPRFPWASDLQDDLVDLLALGGAVDHGRGGRDRLRTPSGPAAPRRPAWGSPAPAP